MYITDLQEIERLAQERYDEFDVMRYRLQYDDDLQDDVIDALVNQIAKPIIEAIDCTQCGNCCRVLDVFIEKQDMPRLIHATNMDEHSLIDAYIDQTPELKAGEVGCFQHIPCPFLQGKRCRIYEYRPDACRQYPEFTPDFRWMLSYLINGTHQCPIIYNVLSELLPHVDNLQRQS